MKDSEVTIEWLKERLEGWEGGNGAYQAWCPCHDDVGSEHKGLSITERPGKAPLLKCHSPQCKATLTRVRQSLEGTTPNGKPELKVNLNGHKSGGMDWWVRKTGVARSVWQALGVEEYHDGVRFTFEGETYYKYRKPPKDFGWSERLGAETPVVWPYPSETLPSEISITVGESDCGTAHATGLPFAFCATKGDETNLTRAHFEAFAERGVTSVLVISDTDEPGLKFREAVEKAAVDADLDVRVVELERVCDPFSGIKDLNGVWRACEDVDKFHALITKATRNAREFDPRMTLQEVSDLLADEEFFYVPGLIAPMDKVIIGGPQKSYKTWLMLDLCRALTAGMPFLNRTIWTPAHPVNTLLIEEEGSRRAWAKRIARMGLTEEQYEHFFTWHRQGFTFTSEESVASLIAYLKQHEIECVIFDPLQRMIPGLDENSSAETAVVWDQVMRMQQAIPTLVCMIAHHTHKGSELGFESLRGSSRHAGEVDLGVFIEKHPLELNKARMKIDGRDYHTEMAPGEVFEADITISDDHFLIDAEDFKVTLKKQQAPTKKERIYNSIVEGNDTRGKLMTATGISDATIRKYLEELIKAGAIKEEKLGEGRPNLYTATSADQQE